MKIASAKLPSERSRFTNLGQAKTEGVVYTPRALAAFVARQILLHAKLPRRGAIKVLDPSCGDGALLDALLESIPEHRLSDVEVVAVDTSSGALQQCAERLEEKFPTVRFRFSNLDFLECAQEFESTFNLVVANPPYVRTQILGSESAQGLAEKFNLSGRVDLYHPFLIAIAGALTAQGTTGIICSNRFLTTRSGQAVREALAQRLRLHHIYDLGDSKLFDAAVLPAVLIGTPRGRKDGVVVPKFSTIYECDRAPTHSALDPLEALTHPNEAVVELLDKRRVLVRHGALEHGGDPSDVWRIGTIASSAWLEKVYQNTWANFRRIGKIRVGVKSTADKVFIRHDWATLPLGEPELLRPLITRACAQRFRAATPPPSQRKKILYPHESTPQGRRAVDINRYPRANAYLNMYREQLEARTYLAEARRNWFELWVPQDPAGWNDPKIVFLDISEEPVFWMDMEGSVVNGECYWLRPDAGVDPDLLWLALAIANSTFIEEFYDHRFNNKLYSGRRRFITQYVELFPLLDPQRTDAREIIRTAKEVYEHMPSATATRLSFELDKMVWQAFGLLSK